MHYFKRYEQKICFYCGSKQVNKNGKIGSIQLYKCKDCGKQFRDIKRLDIKQLSDDYVFGCQSVNRLATKYNVSPSTIHRKLSTIRSTRIISSNKRVVVLMDTTYWGWRFGVVVFKDARTSKILWRKFISKKETLADYQEGVDWLLANNFIIDGVVCDGLRGICFTPLSEGSDHICYDSVFGYNTGRRESVQTLLLIEDAYTFTMSYAEWKLFFLEATKMLLDARPVESPRLTVEALTTTRYWYKDNWYGNTRCFICLDDAKRYAKTEIGNSVTIYTYDKNSSKIVCFAEASGYCPP